MEERKIIKAQNGMMLTNGTDFVRTRYFAIGLEPSNEWYEISEEAYNTLMQQQEKENSDI